MNWFNHNRKEERLKVAKTANLEIAVAKELTDKATAQAIKDANELKALLERNHFSVTLYIAVGGKDPRVKQGKKSNA